MKKIFFMTMFVLLMLSGCSLASDSYKEIESSGQKLDVSSISSGDYETLSGTWVSETGKDEDPTILKINDEGIVSIYYDEEKFANKGQLVISNDGTSSDGYISGNLKGEYEGEPVHIYASGQEGHRIEYKSNASKHIYLIEGDANFNREEIGFDYNRTHEYAIQQQIPKKISKDTLIFQEDEKAEDKGYGMGNPASSLNYLVFHRKGEVNSRQKVGKSDVKFKELNNDNFSSISGQWSSQNGFNLDIDDEGFTTVNGDSRKKGKINLTSSDGDSGALEIESKPLFANGDVGIKDDVNSSAFKIIKSGEEIGKTSITELYDYFEKPDVPPYLSIVDSDIILLSSYYAKNAPRTIYKKVDKIEGNNTISKNGVQIDTDAILNGDYSSLVGSWGIPNAQGLRTKVRIDESGTLYWDDESNGQPISDVIEQKGYLWGVIGEGQTRDSAATSSYIFFIPAGVTMKGGENSDSNKDRIAFGSSVTYYNDPYLYYRLDK
jgi:lipoprotein